MFNLHILFKLAICIVTDTSTIKLDRVSGYSAGGIQNVNMGWQCIMHNCSPHCNQDFVLIYYLLDKHILQLTMAFRFKSCEHIMPSCWIVHHAYHMWLGFITQKGYEIVTSFFRISFLCTTTITVIWRNKLLYIVLIWFFQRW